MSSVMTSRDDDVIKNLFSPVHSIFHFRISSLHGVEVKESVCLFVSRTSTVE